jgi:hypothetical protein
LCLFVCLVGFLLLFLFFFLSSSYVLCAQCFQCLLDCPVLTAPFGCL